MRVASGVLLALLVTSPSLLPSVPAQDGASTRASYSFERIHTGWEFTSITFREIVWHPTGAYALIAGGYRGPSTDPMSGWSLLVRYDNATGKFTSLVNATGPMLFNVRFHPDGSHAIVVGEKDTILRFDHATQTVRNLWLEFQRDYLARNPGEDPPVFLGRGLAYRPDGEYALITGSSMIAYKDGRGFLPALSGDQEYYKAIAFHPSSRYAIVEGGDTDAKGRARLGQLWLIGLDREICERYDNPYPTCKIKFRLPYGLFEPNRADPVDITFHPVINASFVYGYDDAHGTMLRLRDDGTDFAFEWMAVNHQFGKYTDMEFRPRGTRALVTALGDPQIMEFDGLKARVVLDHALCIEMWDRTCMEPESLAWHPTGAYIIVVGLSGGILKMTPRPEPELTLRTPVAHQTFVDKGGETTVFISGNALATTFGTKIDRVQVRIDEGVWNDADVVSRFNPATWRWLWNATGATPGEHLVTARATDSRGYSSDEVSVPIYVQLPPPPLAAPKMTSGNQTSVVGNVTLTWTDVPDADEYLLQRSRTAAFLEKETFPTGGEPRYEFLFGLPNGTWYFRVRAEGGVRPPSEFSDVVTVNVTVGRAVGVATSTPDPDAPTADGGAIEVDLPNGTFEDGNATLPPDEEDDTPQPPPEDEETPPREEPTPGVGFALAVAALAAVALRRRR